MQNIHRTGRTVEGSAIHESSELTARTFQNYYSGKAFRE
jgi:hypothetical protein